MMSVQKITLSASRDIPFNMLVLSQANVRRIVAGVSIKDLAEDIARRTLLQSLNVRPILNGDDKETGMFEVPAGGRRYRALELLVKQGRMSETQPVPCIVRTGGLAEEDSLAENVHRENLLGSVQSVMFGRTDCYRCCFHFYAGRNCILTSNMLPISKRRNSDINFNRCSGEPRTTACRRDDLGLGWGLPVNPDDRKCRAQLGTSVSGHEETLHDCI
jgi:hypothetical protein